MRFINEAMEIKAFPLFKVIIIVINYQPNNGSGYVAVQLGLDPKSFHSWFSNEFVSYQV